MELNIISQNLWVENYKAEGEETVLDTFQRLASTAASIEVPQKQKIYEKKFLDILGDFIPGGRIIANLGREDLSKISTLNCSVDHPENNTLKDPDSIEGIYTFLLRQAQTLKSEMGYGMNFSWIRPSGSYIAGIGGRTPGVVKFMELWDISSDIITAGATPTTELEPNEKLKIRKGAQMGILECWHPDIEEFIEAKRKGNKFKRFNLSVGVTDDFMKAVLNDSDWNLVYPDTKAKEYQTVWKGNIKHWLKNNYPVKIYKTVKARDLWDKIMKSTYNFNDPGVFFIDTANKYNSINYIENIYCTNPCGEIPMSTGICDIGHINLTRFVKDGKFNWERFAEVIELAVRFLDNINDIAYVPLAEYKTSMITKRRIGLGVMGFGSLLYMLGIKYGNNEECLNFTKKLFKFKAETELLANAKLGKEKSSFPLFDPNKYFNTEWWKTLDISLEIKQEIENIGCMRCSHVSMVAPTGNTSIFANLVSGGIEPVFDKTYIRWITVNHHEIDQLRKEGLELPDVFKNEWFETKHFKFATRGKDQILKGEFNGIKYEIDKGRYLTKAIVVNDFGYQYVLDNKMSTDHCITTSDLSIDDHIQVLKIVAHYTMLGISKTVNVPNDYNYEDFKNLYIDAWKSKIKGITTYREGTMTAVLEKIEPQVKDNQTTLEKIFQEAGNNVIKENLRLPDEYYSKGYILRDNHKKKWYVTIGFADSNYKKPFAIFVNTNCNIDKEVTNEFITNIEQLILNSGVNPALVEEQKNKYKNQSNVTKIARVLGMALRHNIPLEKIIFEMDKYNIEVASFLFHLKKLLIKFLPEYTQTQEACPNCGNKIYYVEGCKKCLHCNYSTC